MGWIVAILAIWILAPFANLIFSLIASIIKWTILLFGSIIACFRR